MTSHNIIYHITITVFMTSPPLYLKWHPTTLCHHNICIDGLTPTVCIDITPTLHMPSYALYTMSHPLFITSHHFSYHITSTAFMTLHTLYMMSHTWQ